MTHHKKKSSNEISFRGIPYEYLDQTGHLPIWKIYKFLESSYDTLGFAEKSSSLDSKSQDIIVHQITKVDPEIYSDANLFGKIIPNVTIAYANIRNASYVVRKRMCNELNGKYYAEDFTKAVRVNKDSRRPTPIPNHVRKMYNEYLVPDHGFPASIDSRIFPDQPTKFVYKFKATVLYSDLDRLYHTNHTAYITFCMDCATSAALEGFYKHFTSDMCWYPVEEVDIQYIGESKANDDLVVCTWQDDNLIQKIYFVISLRGKAICKASLLFSLEKLNRVLKGKL